MQTIGKNKVLATTPLGAKTGAIKWMIRGSVTGIAAGGVFLIFEMVVARLTRQKSGRP